MTEAIRVSNTSTFQFVDILTGEEMPGFFTEELAQFCQDYVDNNRRLTAYYYGKDGVTYTVKAVTREQALADDAPEATNTDPDLDLLSDSDDDDQFSFFGAPRPQTQPQVDPDAWLLNLKTKGHIEQWVEVKRLPKAEQPKTKAEIYFESKGITRLDSATIFVDGKVLTHVTVDLCETCGEACTINGAWWNDPDPLAVKRAKALSLALGLESQNEMFVVDEYTETYGCELCS